LLEGVVLRRGTVADVPVILRLMDIATEWLVSQGRTGQWGTEKASDRPDRIKSATEFAESGGLWVAVDEDWKEPNSTAPGEQGKGASPAVDPRDVVGAVCVGEAWPHIKPASEPELYIRFLIANRESKRRGVGAILLAKARELARVAGVEVLRVDCYGGDDQKLVSWYESQGFQREETYTVKEWPGQVLVQRLENERAS
jgi:ribosomal protein S18 acetylase RimI-like enzyme